MPSVPGAVFPDPVVAFLASPRDNSFSGLYQKANEIKDTAAPSRPLVCLQAEASLVPFIIISVVYLRGSTATYLTRPLQGAPTIMFCCSSIP